MAKYGLEHLRFSQNTHKQRQFMLIIGCLSILIFEYHITRDLTIYNVAIPNPLLKLSLTVAVAWATLQFLFSSIDDYIDWKKHFLIEDKVNPYNKQDNNTVVIELASITKGKLIYNTHFGTTYSNHIPEYPYLKEVKDALKNEIERLEKTLKKDVEIIQHFKTWYKRYSWITIFRFAVLEFALPLLFILYAVIICQYYPIFPK